LSNLVVEMLLRLFKPAAAAAIGIGVFALAVGMGEPASLSLGLICFLVGAAVILLVQESLI
jgi:hypothetical protein